MKAISLRIALFAVAALTAAGAFAQAKDVITIGTVPATGTTVDVPVYIRDVSTTPLGVDQPAGSKIQSFSIKVTYSPAAAIQSISFARAGITAGLTPTAEFTPSTSNTVSLIETFSESTSPIPFTLNAAAPGNQVAVLHVTLSSAATPGSAITFTIDTATTQLANQGGTTKETTSDNLSVVNGAINVPNLTLALSPSTLNVATGSNAQVTATINFTQATPTTVTLTSNSTAIATVTSPITIPAGATSATATVHGVAAGTTTINASLSTGATSSANVVVAATQCGEVAAPVVTAPASVTSGTQYTVSWAAVTGANDYTVEESTDAAFTAPASQTTAGLSASFTHTATTENVRYYYRVRSHAHFGACDLISINSNVASVLVTAPAAPQLAMRAIPVVGSVAGNFGSYFRTSVQLFNPQSTTVSGKIIFHTQLATGTSSDPSLAFSLAPGKTISYADLLPAMGVASGLGTADLVADLGSAFPATLIRVFNDGGTAGTTGLAIEAMKTTDALQSGEKGSLVAPADAAKLRLNIGVRSLDAGAAINFVIRDKDGNVVKTVSKTYNATFFQQLPAGQMLDYTFAGGESVSIELTSGSAYVYGSTTDNTSNDPSVQFAHRND